MSAVWRVARAVAALGVGACGGLAAQVDVGAHVEWRSGYVWRGLVRSAGQVLQAGAFGDVRRGALRLAAGAWGSMQAGRGQAGDFNDRGTPERGLSEVNWWAEAGTAGERLELQAGISWLDYRGAGAATRRASTDDSHEFYARLTLPRLPLAPSGVVWLDRDRADGAFVEGTLTAPLPLLPMYANLDVSVSAGASLGQERNPARPGETFVAERRGVSYLDFGVAVSAAAGVRLALHYQVNRDRLTRAVAPGRSSGHLLWIEAGVTTSRTVGR